MVENESFTYIVPKECIRVNVFDRIKSAVSVAVVVLFMKGDRKNPKDGYQKEAIDILERSQVRYSTFNVVTDPDMREILKEYSRFNSYPMLYVDSKF